MFILLFFLPFVIWYCLTLYFEKKGIECFDGSDYDVARILITVFSCILFVVLLGVNLTTISIQKGRYQDLQTLQEKKEIYQKKLSEMTVKYESILIKNYPNYEKEIFDKITPEDFTMLMVKYPELKTALTSINYVDKIKELNDDVYNMDINIRNKVNEIRFCLVNPWVITLFIPNPPDNLKSIVKYPN
jgi:hypothetical protein